MKKIPLVILYVFSGYVIYAQDSLKAAEKIKLHFDATAETNSASFIGYFWKSTDSTVFISHKRKIMSNAVASEYFVVPSENIRMLTISKKRFPLVEMVGGAILGFVLTAGLWENEDVNQDGNLSFWELLYGAIDGLTSEGRTRRKSAMWVGIGGGTIGLVAGAFSSRTIIISLPIEDKHHRFVANKKKFEMFVQ